MVFSVKDMSIVYLFIFYFAVGGDQILLWKQALVDCG